MNERFIRAHFTQLQGIYDRMPYPVQTVLTSARGWFLARNRYSQEMYDLLQELRSHEKWSPEQIADFQLTAIRNIVEHACQSVPFFADYPKLNWKSIEDLGKFPVLTRDVVRQNSDRFLSQRTPKRDCVRVGTTGTTGASLKVAFSPRVARRVWAFRMRQWAWAGIEPRHPRVTLFGSRVVPPNRRTPPYWTSNLPEHQILMSIFHLSERSAPYYIDLLRGHRNRVLEGFPSVLGILADFILQEKDPVPMRIVFTDGEPLYPFLREKIEKAFQTRVYDSYGNTELCGMIQECSRGHMHLIPEFGYLEILDANNRPAKIGEEGYFVWTGFINDTMPLIRYRIGDRGCWQDGGTCACGRAFPLVTPTITRESDLLHCPDGRVFSPRAVNQVLKEAYSFRFCQFIQDQPKRVVVRAVASNGKALEDLADVRSKLQRLLGGGMQVAGELAGEPIVRAGGKIPLIVQEVKRR